MKRSSKKLIRKEPQGHSEPISVDLPVSKYLAKIGRKGGKKTGPARSKKLSTKRKK